MTSINNMYPKKYYYDLGEFVAKTMLDGIIHPDLQLSNVGCNDDNFVFLDFADIEELAIPEDLSDVTLKQLTQSLFSVIRDFMGSLESLTYFHAGFVAYSGLLGQCLFYNMTNHGFSICGYLVNSHIAFSYDPSFIYKYRKNKDIIKDWKNSPLEKITISNYDFLEKYEQSKERKYISKSNLYYMDYLYFSRCYIKLEQSSLDISILIMNMGLVALRSKFYYIAYGLFLKSLSLPTKTVKIISICNKGLSTISKSIHLNIYITNLISNNLNLDLFCLLWLLGELEHCKLIEKE
ncbi:MAG: hypothetical protein OSJ72_01855 [Lachnospiraceae bacterium]|nr:hypothetical protein [Lachnospiraceae bacterium]